MSKTRIFLLITWITGFASFQTIKAVNAVEPEQSFKIPPVPVIFLTDTLPPSIGVDTPRECIKTYLLADPPGADSVKKRKLISALLAFPFPFGFVGAHRVMLGTGPWVPVVYVATLGGCFGLLPLIDFCFITFSKDITPYENNTHIFMWIK